jgi:hypothetical protein
MGKAPKAIGAQTYILNVMHLCRGNFYFAFQSTSSKNNNLPLGNLSTFVMGYNLQVMALNPKP